MWRRFDDGRAIGLQIEVGERIDRLVLAVSNTVRASINCSQITTCCGVLAPNARKPSRNPISLTGINCVV